MQVAVVKRRLVEMGENPRSHFALQRHKGRVAVEQVRVESHQIRFEGFGRHPNRQHFNGMETFVAQMVVHGLAFLFGRVAAQQGKQGQPVRIGDGLHPHAVAVFAEQAGKHVAQIVAVFIGRVDVFVNALVQFAHKALPRENSHADEQRIQAQAAQPLAQQGSGSAAQIGVFAADSHQFRHPAGRFLFAAGTQPRGQSEQQGEGLPFFHLLLDEGQ